LQLEGIEIDFPVQELKGNFNQDLSEQDLNSGA